MGSGSLNAYSILESRYRDNLTMEEATQLAIDAIKAGIIYDNGSGSNVDFVQITEKDIHYERNFEIVGKMSEIKGDYSVIPGNVERISSTTYNFKKGNGDDDNRIQEESVSRHSNDNKIEIET
jgi:hypothetical protein